MAKLTAKEQAIWDLAVKGDVVRDRPQTPAGVESLVKEARKALEAGVTSWLILDILRIMDGFKPELEEVPEKLLKAFQQGAYDASNQDNPYEIGLKYVLAEIRQDPSLIGAASQPDEDRIAEVWERIDAARQFSQSALLKVKEAEKMMKDAGWLR